MANHTKQSSSDLKIRQRANSGSSIPLLESCLIFVVVLCFLPPVPHACSCSRDTAPHQPSACNLDAPRKTPITLTTISTIRLSGGGPPTAPATTTADPRAIAREARARRFANLTTVTPAGGPAAQRGRATAGAPLSAAALGKGPDEKQIIGMAGRGRRLQAAAPPAERPPDGDGRPAPP